MGLLEPACRPRRFRRPDPLEESRRVHSLDALLAQGVNGRRIFVRCDLNVPLADGHITDDGRIRASLPTVAALADAGARVVVGAHLGRPKGQMLAELSLGP